MKYLLLLLALLSARAYAQVVFEEPTKQIRKEEELLCARAIALAKNDVDSARIVFSYYSTNGSRRYENDLIIL